jgi:hypothetical protein
MAVDEDLAERVRAVLARSGELREVRMFGGLCFMLNGNMLREPRSAAFSSLSARSNTRAT